MLPKRSKNKSFPILNEVVVRITVLTVYKRVSPYLECIHYGINWYKGDHVMGNFGWLNPKYFYVVHADTDDREKTNITLTLLTP